MNTRLLAIALAATICATTPLASASYSHSGTLNATFTGVFFTSAHDFKFHANQGDVITVTLTWADTAQDLDLRLIPPGGSCTIAPEPDVPCFESSVGRRVSGVACDDRRPITADHGSETVTVTAATSGTHTASIMAAVAPGSTDYTITITVNGGSPAMVGNQPTRTTYVANSPVCKLP